MTNRKIAIQVEGVSKCYRIGFKENMHDSFGATVFNFLKSPLKNYRAHRSLYKFDDDPSAQSDGQSDVLWALRDVSFNVYEGEVVGIIGLNGAGKSTLLKVLSRITVPTSGRISIRGRVSSLLEVGTGFHPELTGRENVYLNGTILGMRKHEIDRKFDEIVDFSGVERFLETPVKRYSSGMRVRLAFAVAAHLEPEVLLIDEVLAVGDARFQKKCLDKMQSVSEQGRTILFVSHSMPAVTKLCPRIILLNAGGVVADGSAQEAISVYMHSEKGLKAKREWCELEKAPGDEVVRLCAMRVKTEEGRDTETADVCQTIGIEMEYEVLKPRDVLIMYFHVVNEEGIKVFMTVQTDSIPQAGPFKPGRYVSTAWIPGNFLGEGTLYISPTIRSHISGTPHVRERDVVAIQVVSSFDSYPLTSEFLPYRSGVVWPLLKWETQVCSKEETSIASIISAEGSGQIDSPPEVP